MQPTSLPPDETAALREALEKMLFLVNAASAANTSAMSFAHEREALQEKRRRLLRLLEELSSTAPAASYIPHLVSPQADAEAAGAAPTSPDPLQGSERNEEDTEEKDEKGEAGTPPETDPLNTPPHRLLGNVFGCPVGNSNSSSSSHVDVAHCGSHDPYFLTANEVLRRAASLCLHPCEEKPEPTALMELRSRDRNRVGHASRHRISAAHATRTMSPPAATAVKPDFTEGSRQSIAVGRASSPSPRRDVRLYDATSATPSFWINVWPCYGSAAARVTTPTRVLVRGCYRYFDDVVQRAAEQTRCRPACPSLYTPEGHPVRELSRLAAEQHYLIFPSGGFYRKQVVPTSLLWLLYTDARQVVQCS